MKRREFEMIREHKHHHTRVFIARRCLANDQPAILDLQAHVFGMLTDASIFGRIYESELEESLRRDLCVGVYERDRLAAFALLVLPNFSERNLGVKLRYSDEKLLRTMTLDTVFVAPEYRGYGLQRTLLEGAKRLSVELGAKEILATVSPDNPHSLHNFKRCGYHVAGRTVNRNGAPRLIVSLDLSALFSNAASKA